MSSSTFQQRSAAPPGQPAGRIAELIGDQGCRALDVKALRAPALAA